MAKDLLEDTDKDYIRLHVGGLSSDVTEKDLRDRFSSFGKITSIDVVKGYDCACRGFAYVNFDKSADVKKCISILDRTRWRGNLLTIQKANVDYMTRRNTELEARRKKEQEIQEKQKQEAQVTLEENAASKDKNGLWVVNKHGLVLPVLRITNNNGKIVKINPNKYKNAVKRLAADSSGEEELHFADDEVGEAPKKISEDIEIIPEDQMEVDEEETPATKADVAYPFSDDEDDRNYESRDEDDDVPVVPANVQVEKKSALSILEQMFPEEKEFIRKKDAKMEKTRAIELKETGPIGPGVKEALAKIEAKKAAEKAAATKPVAKPEPAKEVKAKETVEKKAVVEPSKEVKPKEAEKKPAVEPVKETKGKKEQEKEKSVPEPIKETKTKETVAEKKTEPAPQPIVNTKKRSREESSSSSSSDDEGDKDDSSSTTSSASSSTDFFESIKRRKIMESAQKQAASEQPKAKKEDRAKVKPVAPQPEQPKAKQQTEEVKKVEEKEESSSSSSDEEEGNDSDSDSDSSSTTSSASSSTEFFEEIRRRKALEQQAKDAKDLKKKAKQEAAVSKPVESLKKAEAKKEELQVVAKPVEPVIQPAPAASNDVQSMQVDEENGKSWVDIMTQYETERLKPVTILAPKAVWKLFPDRDDSNTAAPVATTTSGNAMEVEPTADKPAEEKKDIGVASKDYKPFFPFIGNGEKLIGDTLVRTKTLEEIEEEWRREKVFLTQDYKKKQSIAVKKRRKLEKKQR